MRLLGEDDRDEPLVVQKVMLLEDHPTTATPSTSPTVHEEVIVEEINEEQKTAEDIPLDEEDRENNEPITTTLLDEQTEEKNKNKNKNKTEGEEGLRKRREEEK